MKQIKSYPINHSPLYKLSNKTKLADILGIDKRYLLHFKYTRDNYKCWERPKKNDNGTRPVEDPNYELKKIQSKLNKLLSRIITSEYLMSGKKYSSYIVNAQYHKDNPYVFCFDLSKFFQKATRKYIFTAFVSEFKMSDDIAWLITDLVTIPNEDNSDGYIPTGSPSSQSVIYWAYKPLFDKILLISEQKQLKFSLYVDDMTFSSDKPIKSDFPKTIEKMCAKVGLEINDTKTKEISKSINYYSGIPIGFKKFDKFYIYNHLIFYIEINEQNNKYQVVNFYVSAHSAKQNSDRECLHHEMASPYFKLDDSNNSTDEIPDDNSTDPQNRIFNVLEEDIFRYYKDAELQELEPGNIGFTYDVIFLKSNKTFASRYDNYFTFKGRKRYHWGSLALSNILILFLTLIIFFILSRTVKKDLDKYNQKVTIGDNVILDEYGWKQIASDVFRPPIHQKTLSAFIGTGFEIFCLIIVSLILYLIGLKKPEIRLNMIDTIFICFFLFSIISGYVSTFIYRNNGGKEWVKNSIVTAMLCPIIALFVLGVVRLLLTFERSNAGFKISHMALLCFLWLFVSSPLVFVGSLLALMKKTIKYPCKVNALPTAIGEKPWYLHLQYISWFIGIIPFFTFFIEFVYLMKSLWSFNVYYLAWYFSLSLLFSIILTSEISIIYVFINLCHGDHKWWWKSFFVSASPALYVFIYSVMYFFHIELTRFSAIVIYFLIMILISIIIALVLGSLGTLLTFKFVFYIYSKIKFD